MATEKNVNTGNSEKKHNKFASWFLGLPKWGKGLLIGGTAAVVATAITVPTVLVLTKNNGGSAVTEAEFKAALDYLKSPVSGDKDNRNFEFSCIAKGSGVKEGKTETMAESLKCKYANGYQDVSGGMSMDGSTNNHSCRALYLGDGDYFCLSKEWDSPEEQEPSTYKHEVCGYEGIDEDTGSLLAALANCKYEYNKLSFNNGSYNGEFTFTIDDEDYKFNSSFTFGSNKKLIKVYSTFDLIIETSQVKGEINAEFSNFDKTTVDFNKSDFNLYEMKSSDTSANIGKVAEDDARGVFIKADVAGALKNKTISVSNNSYISKLISGGIDILDGKGSGTSIKLGDYGEQIKDQILVGVCSNDHGAADITLTISQ